jgi:hypothetical protein
MPYLTEREPERHSPSEMDPAQPELRPATDDGTGQLLRAGGGTLLVGILAALLTETVFGGIGLEGPHTNSGWLALLVALGCLPFGSLLFLLGAAKWLRNRSIAKKKV